MNETQSMVARLCCSLASPHSVSSRARVARGWFRLFLLLIGLSADPKNAQAATAEAQLDRSTASVGETVTLSLRVEGATLRGGHPTPPNLDGLKVTPAGQSSQISIVNGRRSMQLQLTYQVELEKPGDYTIPSFNVPTDAGTLRTRPLSLKVAKPSPMNLANSPAFLQIAVPKKEVYLGELLPVDIQLYVEEARLVQGPQLTGEGFNVGKIADPTKANTRINNRNLTLVTFRTVVTPVKTGPLSLGPVSMILDVPVPGSRPDVFFGRPSQRIKPTSEEVKITVLPLPAGAPPEFTGAVGKYEMSYTAGPTTLAVGDPITLKLAISGQGAIEGLTLPKLDHWKGFKFYPASTRTELGDPLELGGTKYFEQVVVPQSPETQTLPAFQWSFFDPDERAYRTLTGAAIPLQLSSVAVSSAPPPMLGTNGPAGGADRAAGLLHIRPQMGIALQAPRPLWDQRWFLAAQLIPIGLWGVLRLQRLRQESLANNPRLKRQREVGVLVAAGLRDLRMQASGQQPDVFFETMVKVLRAQIGQKLDLPESGLTEAVIDEKLAPRGLPAEAATELHDLFRQSNQFRYAPQMTAAKLTELVPRVESALNAIKSLPD
jgi:hypothetical protein